MSGVTLSNNSLIVWTDKEVAYLNKSKWSPEKSPLKLDVAGIRIHTYDDENKKSPEILEVLSRSIWHPPQVEQQIKLKNQYQERIEIKLKTIEDECIMMSFDLTDNEHVA